MPSRQSCARRTLALVMNLQPLKPRRPPIPPVTQLKRILSRGPSLLGLKPDQKLLQLGGQRRLKFQELSRLRVDELKPR